jgi:DNA polymerase-3 subunit delta
MFYIFHGDEEFVRSEEVSRLKQQIAEDGMGDLNISTLDGQKLELGELMNVCNTMPFLTNRRLIIVENMLQRYEGQKRRRKRSRSKSDEDDGEIDKLLDYLTRLPDTTRLLFVEDRTLKKSNPVLKQAKAIEDGYVREFSAPDGRNLSGWIAHRARAKGAEINRQAVQLLVTFVGDDLRLLDQELEKLAAYVQYQRPIDAQDVKALVSGAQEANIFAMVDSLGMRQGNRAMEQLQRLLDSGANELYLLTMIERQIRLILSAKDLSEQVGLSATEIRRKLRISHQFIVDKLLQQARRFELEELETLLRRVLDIDQAIKTGRIEPRLAIEMLALEVCARRSSKRRQRSSSRSRTR